MFETLNQYFPLIVFAVSGLTLFARRSVEQGKYPVWLYFFLTLGFLQPWLCINYFRITDLWLFSVQTLTALMLMVARFNQVSDESWLKSSASLLVGLLFLHVSLHPSFGIPFPMSSEWVWCLTVSSMIVAIFLLFGLPPLQLGTLDLGSEHNAKLQLHTTILYRFVLAFFFIAHIQGSQWFENIYELQALIAGFILLGLAFSRIVLRVQTNLYRILAYLSCSLALPIALSMYFLDFGPMSLIVIVVALLPFVSLLNVESPLESDGVDLYNLSNFHRFHAKSAKHFFIWLKGFLVAESLLCLGLVVFFSLQAQYLTAATALLALFSTIGVVCDKQAFIPRAFAHN